MDVVSLVQQQLDAYNSRDLHHFMSVFGDDVVVFRPPAPAPALTGLAAVAAFFSTQRFNLPGLRAELLNRTVLGNKVFDHERIHGVLAQPYEILVVYEVRDLLIRTVWSFSAS